MIVSQYFSILPMVQIRQFWYFPLTLPSRMYSSGLSTLQHSRCGRGVPVCTHPLCLLSIDKAGITLVNLVPELSWGKSYCTTDIKVYCPLRSMESSNKLFSRCCIYKIKILTHSHTEIPYHVLELLCKAWPN